MAAFPALTALAGAVINADTGVVIGSKALNTQLRQASTTKTMTLLLACEYNPALDDVLTASSYAAGVGGSSAELVAGETWTMEMALFGMMMPSGNDAATMIAEHIGQYYLGAAAGSAARTAFIARMNARAAELGMTNTVYQNAHGIDVTSAPQYTTARDLAKLGAAAFTNAQARYIAGTTAIAGIPLTGSSAPRRWSGNYMLGAYQAAAGKTGSTTLALNCLVMLYEVGGRRYAGAVLGCDDPNIRNDEMATMFEYAADLDGATGSLAGVSAASHARVSNGFTDTSYLPGLYRYGFGVFSSTPGHSREFNFWGTDFRLIAPTAPSRGIAEVSIDGGAPIDVDLYSAASVAEVEVFAAQLPDGPHTVRVTVSGRKRAASSAVTIALDVLDVRRERSVSAEPSVVVYDLRRRLAGGSTYTNYPVQSDLAQFIAATSLPNGDYVLEGRARDESDDAATDWESLPFTVQHAVVDPPPDAWLAINGAVYAMLAEGIEELEPQLAAGEVVPSWDGTDLLSTADGEIRGWRIPVRHIVGAPHTTFRSRIARRRRVTIGGKVFGPDLATGFAATVELDGDAYAQMLDRSHSREPVITVWQVDRG